MKTAFLVLCGLGTVQAAVKIVSSAHVVDTNTGNGDAKSSCVEGAHDNEVVQVQGKTYHFEGSLYPCCVHARIHMFNSCTGCYKNFDGTSEKFQCGVPYHQGKSLI